MANCGSLASWWEDAIYRLLALVINGDSDRMVPTQSTVDLDRRLPNSQLVLYPDAGHGGVFQFHQDFVKRALEFL
jgi:pimeloyl-ACP methyl ester carboxylesterase